MTTAPTQVPQEILDQLPHAEAVARLNAVGHALAAVVQLHVNLCHLTGQHDVAHALVEMFRMQQFDLLAETFSKMALSYPVERAGPAH